MRFIGGASEGLTRWSTIVADGESVQTAYFFVDSLSAHIVPRRTFADAASGNCAQADPNAHVVWAEINPRLTLSGNSSAGRRRGNAPEHVASASHRSGAPDSPRHRFAGVRARQRIYAAERRGGLMPHVGV
jgi:hypothetical protein